MGQALHKQPSEHVQHAVEVETTSVSKIAVEAEMKIHTYRDSLVNLLIDQLSNTLI